MPPLKELQPSNVPSSHQTSGSVDALDNPPKSSPQTPKINRQTSENPQATELSEAEKTASTDGVSVQQTSTSASSCATEHEHMATSTDTSIGSEQSPDATAAGPRQAANPADAAKEEIPTTEDVSADQTLSNSAASEAVGEGGSSKEDAGKSSAEGASTHKASSTTESADDQKAAAGAKKLFKNDDEGVTQAADRSESDISELEKMLQKPAASSNQSDISELEKLMKESEARSDAAASNRAAAESREAEPAAADANRRDTLSDADSEEETLDDSMEGAGLSTPQEEEKEKAGTEEDPESSFATADEALRAAESARSLGNEAFSTGQFYRAMACYLLTSRHLSSASQLETDDDLGQSDYVCRKWECIEKSKLNIAACALKLQDYAACIKACSEILEVKPDCVKALYRCGLAYMEQKDYSAAKSHLQKAVALFPSDKAIQQSLRDCLMREREAQSQMRDFAKKMFKSDSPTKSPPKDAAPEGARNLAEEKRRGGERDEDAVRGGGGGLRDRAQAEAAAAETTDTSTDDDMTEGSEEEEEEEDGEEEEEEEEEEDEEEDEVAKETERLRNDFFKFTGTMPGQRREGAREAVGAGGAGGARGAEPARTQTQTAEELRSNWRNILSERERKVLMEELARSRRELETELNRQDKGVWPLNEQQKTAAAAAESAQQRAAAAERARIMREKLAQEILTPRDAPRERPTPRGEREERPGLPTHLEGGGGRAGLEKGFLAPRAQDKERESKPAERPLSVIEKSAEESKERGNEFFKRQMWDQAAREYSSAVNLSKLSSFQRPHLAAIYLSNRAACYIRMDRNSEALADCEKSLELNPAFWKAAVRAGKAVMLMGDFEKAVNFFEKAEALSGTVAEDAVKAKRMLDEVRKVSQLLEAKEPERALSCMNSIIAETPNAMPLMLLHAKVLMACKRFEEVMPLIQQLRAEGSEEATDARLQHMQAQALQGLSRLGEALAKYRELVRQDPDNRAVQSDFKKAKLMANKMNEGLEGLSAHRFSQSRELFGEAAEMDPANDNFVALMHSYRAMAFQKQREEVIEGEQLEKSALQEVQEAKVELEKAQRRLIKGHEKLQQLQRRAGRLKEQFTADEQVAASVMDPSPPFKADGEEVAGKWALHQAIEDACTALDRDPQCPVALVSRARSYIEIGDLSEGVSDYERALAAPAEKWAARDGLSATAVKQELREARAKLEANPVDHYKVLGLGEEGSAASEPDIKRAYRRLAMKYHPDKQSHLGREVRERMERRFKQISEANSILSDSTERRLYDLKKARQGYRSSGRWGSFGGSSASSAARSRASASSGYGAYSQYARSQSYRSGRGYSYHDDDDDPFG